MVDRGRGLFFFSREGKNLFGKQQKRKPPYPAGSSGVNSRKASFLPVKPFSLVNSMVEHASGHGDESVRRDAFA